MRIGKCSPATMGRPSGVRRKDLAKEPSTLKELADWFVDEFPEEAARILTAEAKTMH
jgi:hypothetical protein